MSEFEGWAKKHLRPTDEVVLEATTNAWYFYDLLEPLVARVVVGHPPHIKLIAAALVKTDKKDTMTLAKLLSVNMIPAVWVPPQEVQHVLAEDLTAGVANGHVFRLHIDAGNFGMLRIYLHPAALTESSTAAPPGMPTVLSLSPHTARRVRWLAQTIPALLERGEITTTPLPSAIRAALARLDDLPEGCTLGQLTVAPRLLLPHLKALARALNQLGPRLLARRGTPPTHDAPQGPSATSRRGQVVGPRRGDTS